MTAAGLLRTSLVRNLSCSLHGNDYGARLLLRKLIVQEIGTEGSNVLEVTACIRATMSCSSTSQKGLIGKALRYQAQILRACLFSVQLPY